MYIIIAYDVSIERVNKVKSFLRTQLTWVQNSLFEGEITEAKSFEVIQKLNQIIDPSYDTLTIYCIPNKNALTRINKGTKKGDPEDRVI